ncbi:hypothetical protein [Streptomyces leeuwenhoekii]|uniref:Uncharacterized protein n=1 Tax=Streptomyces leeuwenhoekii TaxID=1437453 RepID=A0A0F7VPC3_STRLW|nr:hypothetical protein [Streptomyces leeuwenhoekii]CQR60313.1 Hypothetical Protein sle_08500 [Streptomyces leeuwenhoekii]
MSTLVPRSRRRRFPEPGAAAPRQPLDRAKVGRRAVGMTAAEAAVALEDARLQPGPTACTDAIGSLPAAVRALLAALARTGGPAADGELEFADRLAQAAPAATDALAAWLHRVLAPAEPVEAGEGGAR